MNNKKSQIIKADVKVGGKLTKLFIHLKNNEIHKDDGPAFYLNDGSLSVYFDHGKIHRDGGPAIIEKNRRFYVKNNKLHNKNGPALIRFPNVKANVLTRNKKEWYYENRYFGS